ncbi:MAG TPA: TatD family hydrolase [Kiritimatiellia bacterium]|jgi:TatD DNase family protein|nr:TatD family hydrolase [Kiritimatiellia bacterium]HOR74368.1 TatD family hydrolase [Kiritimatiellia bacterium]HOU58576.1 TatD family hydrolase [Kiritimatiellia bacterium]HPK68826.1 TatD family hydrolase [Kiritimatiellia bacterium]HQF20532.1 TatD family hydrolase [Kiritimatiellia bacterium]
MMLFDTHAHFDTFAAEGRVAEVLARARAAGVERICAVGSSEASNELVVQLAQKHPAQLVAAVGYDRDQTDKPRDPARLATLAQAPGVVAIGEIGLDYYYSAETAPAQRELFGAMLAGAAAARKPVIVHSRYADEDTIAMLGEFSTVWKKLFHTVEKNAETFPHCGKNAPDFSTPWKKVFHSVENLPPAADAPPPPPPGVLHCFTGDAAFAAELVALGFMISFSGIVSFNNAGPLREVARQIPAGQLLVETDCPYLTPKPFRGKVNEPAYVARVAEVVAEARGVPVAAVAEQTWANACRLFQMEG